MTIYSCVRCFLHEYKSTEQWFNICTSMTSQVYGITVFTYGKKNFLHDIQNNTIYIYKHRNIYCIRILIYMNKNEIILPPNYKFNITFNGTVFLLCSWNFLVVYGYTRFPPTSAFTGSRFSGQILSFYCKMNKKLLKIRLFLLTKNWGNYNQKSVLRLPNWYLHGNPAENVTWIYKESVGQ